IIGRVQRRGPRLHRAALAVAIAAALVSVRETVQEQKVENLILPSGGRRRESPPRQRTGVKVQKTLLDLAGHGCLPWGPDVSSCPAAARSATIKASSRRTRPEGIDASPWRRRTSISDFSLPVISHKMRRARLRMGYVNVIRRRPW